MPYRGIYIREFNPGELTDWLTVSTSSGAATLNRRKNQASSERQISQSQDDERIEVKPGLQSQSV